MLNTFRALLFTSALVALYYYYGSLPTFSDTDKRSPTVIPSETGVYWGQNKLGVSQYIGDKSKQEPSLAQICSSLPHNIIIVGFIKKHFSLSSMPALDLSTHCTTTYYGGKASDIVPLKCTSIGNDIKTCQNMGKKVFISLSPSLDISSSEDGVKSATNIYNAFLSPSSFSYQPFGDAVFDGIDLFLRGNGGDGYASFVRTIRSLSEKDNRRVLIMASPRCSYPDALIGPVYGNKVLTSIPEMIDYLNIVIGSSPDCSFINRDFFYATFQKWSQFVSTLSKKPTILLTLPAWNGFVDAAPGDYITVTDLLAESVITKLRQQGLFGVVLYDGSAESLSRPCNQDSRTYGGVIADILRYGNTTCPSNPNDPMPKNTGTPPTTKKQFGNGGSFDDNSAESQKRQTLFCWLNFLLLVALTVSF